MSFARNNYTYYMFIFLKDQMNLLHKFFSQTENLDEDRIYIWNVCLNEGIHTIVLIDYSVYGTSSVTLTGSGVDLSLQFSPSGVERTFNVLMPPSNLHYDSDWIVRRTGELFSVTPTYDGSSSTFSISSGSLPSGLTLNPETGVISGTPVAYVIDRSVTIKLANAAGSITKQILFSVLINPTNCVGDEVLTTIVRTTKNYALIEGFTIYEGSSTSGIVKFIQPTLGDNKVYTWTVCLSRMVHTMYLTLDYGESWRANSNVVISIPDGILGTFTRTEYYLIYSIRLVAPTSFSYEDTPYTIPTNIEFSVTPTILGSLITYSTTSTLPTGLSLNTATGIISGTPTVPISNQVITVKATNPFGEVTTTITITVMTPPLSLSYPTNSIPKLQEVTINPVYSGGPCTFTIAYGSLPSGLTINSSTGTNSGTPTTVGIYVMKITAVNDGGIDNFIIGIAVMNIPTIQYPQAKYSIVRNTDNCFTPIYTGEYVQFVLKGELPYGFVLNTETGDICGNSPQTDEKTFEVLIVNNVGAASTTLTIKVNLFSVGTWIFIILLIIIVITGLSIVLYQFAHRPKQLPIEDKPELPEPVPMNHDSDSDSEPNIGGGGNHIEVKVDLHVGP